MDILALLQPIEDSLSKATLRQMSRVILAMLAMTGRVTMLGLSRWAEAGGSYRSIQRFYNTAIPWAPVFWQFFSQHLLRKEAVYILAGDESVISKAGKKTYGLDRFFSGLQQKVIPSLSFFVVSLVSVNQRRSYPVCVEQTVRSQAEKAACKAKKAAKNVKSAEPKRKRGRPTGSQNKEKSEVRLNPELFRIQKMLKALLLRIGALLHPVYLAMDGHFGNYPAFQMVRQCGLHLISKLRWDAALCFAWDSKGDKCKYGKRVDYAHIPEKYRKSTTVKAGFQTCTYQAQLLHQDFPVPLNVVSLVKTNLTTRSWGHVILYSSDLELSCENLVDYYALRFQIEIGFISQNIEIEQAFATTCRLYPGYRVRFVGDSGLDDQKMCAQIEYLKQEFVFRVSHLERIVEVYNDRLDRWETEVLQDLTDTVPYQATFQVLFHHAGRTRLDTVKFGWFQIRLPAHRQPNLWILVADAPNFEHPLVLITHVPLETSSILQQVYPDWRLRGRIEHGYRFDQE